MGGVTVKKIILSLLLTVWLSAFNFNAQSTSNFDAQSNTKGGNLCLFQNTAHKNIPNATWTNVTSIQEYETTTGWVNNGVFTATEDGLFEISWFATFGKAGASGKRFIMRLTKNGNLVGQVEIGHQGKGIYPTQNIIKIIKLKAGDKIHFEVYQNTGKTLPIKDANFTFGYIKKI